MAANVATLAIYVDYQRVYDRIWHAILLTEFWRLGISQGMLTMIVSWLKEKTASVISGEKFSEIFNINIGL